MAHLRVDPILKKGEKLSWALWERPEVKDQSASMVSFWWELSPWRVDGRREKELLRPLALLLSTLTPSRGPTFITSSKSNWLPKAPSPYTITLGVRASLCKFGGTQLSQEQKLSAGGSSVGIGCKDGFVSQGHHLVTEQDRNSVVCGRGTCGKGRFLGTSLNCAPHSQTELGEGCEQCGGREHTFCWFYKTGIIIWSGHLEA